MALSIARCKKGGEKNEDRGPGTSVAMSPELGRAAFRVATFLVMLALGLLFVVPRDSPAFVAAVLSAFIGSLFAVLVIVVVRRSR
jgi:hypothetical protein